MMNETNRADLIQAVQALKQGDDALWSALAPLSRIASDRTDLSIDFSTEATLGAPVIVARPKAMPGPHLTHRQGQVCQELAKGLANKDIAARLGISVATVKDHVHAILQRTGLRSRGEIIASMHGSVTSRTDHADPSI